MNISQYLQQDAVGLAQCIRSGQASAEEVLNCALSRMKEVNPKINAIVTDCREWGLEQLQSMRGDEPFYGVPLVVKDLGFELKGVRTSEGSHYFAQNTASVTSDFIKRLTSLGLVPFAKTNTPELGLSYVTEPTLFGPCRNPYDLQRTPGGSSGGSAASVAAGITPIATASDGGGSIRIPASCCGLFGFKPTHGLMPTGPWSEESWSGLATNYLLTRTVRDAFQFFNFLSSSPLKKPLSTKPITIVHLDDAFLPVPIATPCMQAVQLVSELLLQTGYTVTRKSLPLNLQAINDSTLSLIAANTCAAIEKQARTTKNTPSSQNLEPITWEFYQRGQRLSASQLIQAKNTLYQCMRPLKQYLQGPFVILTPALAQLPLAIGALRMNDPFEEYLQKNADFSPFTSLFNQAGLPAMTIPVSTHQRLPISVQFAAGKNQDVLLFQLATALQPFLPDFSQPVTP